MIEECREEKQSSRRISENGNQSNQTSETKVYPIRWFILMIFVLYSASNAMQWTEYTIIDQTVCRFYGVSRFYVNMTSIIYMITYIPLIFPASYLLDKLGLRWAILLGATGNALGSWIKVLSVAPDRFWLTFIGQTVVAVSQTFVLSVPARLAAVWFGPDQVSSACSIGVFGNQLGIAIGFLFPPMLVPDSHDIATVEHGFRVMFYTVAVFTSTIFVLVVLFFKAEPPLPPSVSQVVQREAESRENFFQSMRRLLTNFGYLLLLLSYGINVGVFYAISTLLNSIIQKHFPHKNEDAGRIGLTIVCAGMLGSVLCGMILDKTHKFKETTLGVYVYSLLSMIVFTFTLNVDYISVVYIVSGLLGFFMTGYLPVGFEFASELTYPEPEGTVAGLLNAVTQVFGIIFTFIYGKIFYDEEGNAGNDLWANSVLCFMLGIGAFVTLVIPNDLRRQNATKH